jgi:hypothetical protein
VGLDVLDSEDGDCAVLAVDLHGIAPGQAAQVVGDGRASLGGIDVAEDDGVAALARAGAEFVPAGDGRLVVASVTHSPGNRNDTLVYRTSGIRPTLVGRTTVADGANEATRRALAFGEPEAVYSSRPGL